MSVSSDEQSNLPWKWIVAGLILVAAVVGCLLVPLDSRTKEGLNEWVQHTGIRSTLIFAIVYIVATVFLLPASPLSIAAGLTFGAAWGVVLVTVSATIGAAAVAKGCKPVDMAGVVHAYPTVGCRDQPLRSQFLSLTQASQPHQHAAGRAVQSLDTLKCT